MDQNHEAWRFMRKRAEQLYEEGETRRALRMMRLINREQERAFGQTGETKEKCKKIVSTR